MYKLHSIFIHSCKKSTKDGPRSPSFAFLIESDISDQTFISLFNVFKYFLESLERFINDLGCIRERCVQAASGKRYDTVCHICSAHALHRILADIHHILVL